MPVCPYDDYFSFPGDQKNQDSTAHGGGKEITIHSFSPQGFAILQINRMGNPPYESENTKFSTTKLVGTEGVFRLMVCSIVTSSKPVGGGLIMRRRLPRPPDPQQAKEWPPAKWGRKRFVCQDCLGLSPRQYCPFYIHRITSMRL